MNNFSYIFFGTGPLAESVLASLVRGGMVPKYVVTKPDSPQGRHLEITPPRIKVWCEMKHIPVLQPEDLHNLPSHSPILDKEIDVFVVASYGKMIPENVLNIPKFGALNVHPSLLPLYRGASPIESALLNGEEETGVTIMKLDNEMDHGPVIAQTKFAINKEATAGLLEVECGQIGGALLTGVLTEYIAGNIKPVEQDHDKATYCKKIEKEMGEIDLNEPAEDVQRKWRALSPWPGLYFFIDHHGKKTRVKVNSVNLKKTARRHEDTAKSVILKVTPEGRHEIPFDDFARGYLN